MYHTVFGLQMFLSMHAPTLLNHHSWLMRNFTQGHKGTENQAPHKATLWRNLANGQGNLLTNCAAAHLLAMVSRLIFVVLTNGHL
jgi:hypothetical protein